MNISRISVVMSFILSVFAAITMAGAGPHTILLSTNQTDRLTQVEVAFDGDTVYESAYNCRRTNPAGGDYNIYFNLDDGYIFGGNYPIAHISVAYYDIGTGSFNVQYDGANDIWQPTSIVQLTNTGQLKWATFDLLDAYFGNRQHSAFDFRICGGTSSPVYVSTVYVWCRKETAGSVSVSNGQFTINNERFVMVGANYIPPYQTQWGNAEQVWKTLYNSAVIERDFTNMEQAGVNAIRCFMAFWDYICPSEGTLDSTVIANLKDFYQRAENHGIKVQLCVGGFPTWLGSNVVRDYGGWPQYADLWSNFEIRRERADFLVQLINDAELGDYDSFLSFDLENEAAFAYAGGTAQEFYNSLSSPAGSSNSPLRAWNQWVNAKYGSLSNAYSAWGYQGGSDTAAVVFPDIQSHFVGSGDWDKKVDDYYAFVADCFTDTVAYTRSRVQSEALPRAMITVDCVIRGLSDSLTADTFTISILTTDVRRISQACDYISFNIYNGFSTDPVWYRERLVELVSMGLDKPVVLTEFGYPAEAGNATALENERIMWAGMVDAAAEARVDGCMGWMWIDTLDTTLADADFGIVYSDTTAKPAYLEFQKRKVELLTASEPVANCTLDIDMDEFVAPIEAFYSAGRQQMVDMFDNGQYPNVINHYRETSAAVTTWNLANDFSNVENPSNDWSYGVIGGPNNSTGFAKHPGVSSYAGFDYWWTNTPGQNNTARGFVIHNPSLSTALKLTGGSSVWGDSSVLRPNEAALTSSVYNISDKQTFRWTAPADGTYDVSITFSGLSYGGTGTNCTVYVALNNANIFTNTISGFIGSSEFLIPAFGTKPSAVYNNTLTLSAGNTVDVFKNNTATVTGNSVGIDMTIFKAPDAPGFDVQLPLYVSPDGSDNNNGTIDSPFATIERAKDIVKWLIYDGLTEDVHVYLRQGTYYLNQPLTFTASDSDPDYTITYEAYPGETPVISGGREITGWMPIGDGKYAVTLPDVANGDWWFRQLWSDNGRCRRAMWPNPDVAITTETAVSTDKKTITLSQNIPGSDFAANDTEIMQFNMFSTSRARIVDRPTANSITTASVCGTLNWDVRMGEPQASKYCWLEHNPAFVDQANEWHLNRSTGLLIWLPPAGTHTVIAPKLDKLVIVKGDSANKVSNLIFKGLSFKHTGWDYPSFGYGGIQSGAYGPDITSTVYRIHPAIELLYADNCAIENCYISNIATTGVGFGRGCVDCRITGSKLTDIGGSGIMSGWDGTGSSYTQAAISAGEAPRGTVISNNYVYDCSVEWIGCVGIMDCYTKFTEISNNIVQNMPYTGISSGWGWDKTAYAQEGVLIEKNHIHDVMYPLSDGGAIYMNGNHQGGVVSGNLVHDVSLGMYSDYLTWPHPAVYWDNGASNLHLDTTLSYNIAAADDFWQNTTTPYEGRTFGTNYLDRAPGTWGPTEQAIADAAGTQPAAPVLTAVFNQATNSYLFTADCQSWAYVANAVIVETALNITNLFTIGENGQVSAAIPATLLSSTATATIELTISDPEGDTAVGLWSIRNGWDVADDFSGTNGNPNAAWSYGYKASNGIFTLLPAFGSHYYMSMSGWFIQDSWQAVCMVNEDAQPHNAEFWGSNYYAEPQSTYLAQTNSAGQKVVYRWTAPADGMYYLDAGFTGAIYSGGMTNCNVSVVVNNTNTAFSDYVYGFIGGGEHPAGGIKPAALCKGVLSLAAGDTVDFSQSDRNSSGNDITRLSASIILLGPAVSYNNGDFNLDGQVNNDDLYTLALHWLEAYNPTYYLRPVGDVTNDKIVNLNDFTVIAEGWLK